MKEKVRIGGIFEMQKILKVNSFDSCYQSYVIMLSTWEYYTHLRICLINLSTYAVVGGSADPMGGLATI